MATLTTNLARRVAQLEAARRAERDALAWPEMLAAWRVMVAKRRAEVDQTLEDFNHDHENTVSPY